eukprot:gene11617-biopygen21413
MQEAGIPPLEDTGNRMFRRSIVKASGGSVARGCRQLVVPPLEDVGSWRFRHSEMQAAGVSRSRMPAAGSSAARGSKQLEVSPLRNAGCWSPPLENAGNWRFRSSRMLAAGGSAARDCTGVAPWPRLPAGWAGAAPPPLPSCVAAARSRRPRPRPARPTPLCSPPASAALPPALRRTWLCGVAPAVMWCSQWRANQLLEAGSRCGARPPMGSPSASPAGAARAAARAPTGASVGPMRPGLVDPVAGLRMTPTPPVVHNSPFGLAMRKMPLPHSLELPPPLGSMGPRQPYNRRVLTPIWGVIVCPIWKEWPTAAGTPRPLLLG